MRISPPTAPSGTALPSRAANEAYRNAQKRFNQQPSPPIDDFINTIGQYRTCVIAGFVGVQLADLLSARRNDLGLVKHIGDMAIIPDGGDHLVFKSQQNGIPP